MPTWTEWNRHPVEYQESRKSSAARWEHDRKEAKRLHQIAEVKPRVDSRLPQLSQSRCSSRPSSIASTRTSTSSRSRSSTPIRVSNTEQWRIFETSILGPRSRECFTSPLETKSTDGVAATSKNLFDCTQRPAFVDLTLNPKKTRLALPPLQPQRRSSHRRRDQSDDVDIAGVTVAGYQSLNSTSKTLLCTASPYESVCVEEPATTLNFSVTLDLTPTAEQTAIASEGEEYENEFEKYDEEEEN